MREVLDLRIDEEWASKYLGTGIGTPMPLGTGVPPITRQVLLESHDPVVSTIRKRVIEYEGAKDDAPCIVLLSRDYSDQELAASAILRLNITTFLNFYGEQYGTTYNLADSCPTCGTGRRQESALILDTQRVPKDTDFAVTITSDEWVISDRLARILQQGRISGYDVRPIVDIHDRQESSKWHQLVITNSWSEACAPTRFGIDFFHDDVEGEFVCPQHHLSGLNLLSELFVRPSGDPATDIAKCHTRIGRFAQWIVPAPIILVSQRLARILRENGVRGYGLEVVHVC